MKFILAGNNEKKIAEMREILSEFNAEIVSQREAGFYEAAEETGATFAENAYIKAKAACDFFSEPSIADDSGLCVDALQGAPGVYSARYGGGLSDDERCLYLLKNMEYKEQRSARFVSSIACVFPNGDVIRAEGVCEGEITRTPKGNGGFGYDPVFYLPELGKTMAEMEPFEKNAVSHRGKALRDFKIKLDEYMKGPNNADK